MKKRKKYICYFAFLFLASTIGQGCNSSKKHLSTATPSVPEPASETKAAKIFGRLYTKTKEGPYNKVATLNLNQKDWHKDKEYPFCPALFSLRNNEGIDSKSDVLPFNFRIPYPVSYADLEHFNLIVLIKLDNNKFASLIPAGIKNELLTRAINYKDLPIFIALYEAHFNQGCSITIPITGPTMR